MKFKSKVTQMLQYLDIRNEIDNGDLIFVARGDTFFSKATEVVTRSPFYHVGIALWLRDSAYESRLFLAEAHQGGRRVVSLSSYSNHPLTVVQSEVPFAAYSKDLLERSGSVPYGYMDFVAIGLRERFGIKIGNYGGEVCSEMVAAQLNKGGLYLPTLVSPGKLYNRLVHEMDWKIRCVTCANVKHT